MGSLQERPSSWLEFQMYQLKHNLSMEYTIDQSIVDTAPVSQKNTLQIIIQALYRVLGPTRWDTYKANVINILTSSYDVEQSMNTINHIVHSKPVAILMHNDIGVYAMHNGSHRLPFYTNPHFAESEEAQEYLNLFKVLEVGDESTDWVDKIIEWMENTTSQCQLEEDKKHAEEIEKLVGLAEVLNLM